MDIEFPFHGRWLVQNSPADRVPSHGTAVYGSSHAIDFVPVDDSGRTAPFTPRSLIATEPPHLFPGFGRALFAPVTGRVITVDDQQTDHSAHRGLPSISYAATQSRRLAEGWQALAGNHIIIETPGGCVVLCHLQHNSAEVVAGSSISLGDPIARVGNTGNSTEPHLHLQAVDSPDFGRAQAVPLSFNGRVPRNGEVIDVAAGQG